jgi:uncharacterized protein involved in type VI secretion and phage assembly
MLGQGATLRIVPGYKYAMAGERMWSGLCNHVRLAHAVALGPAEAGLSTYEISIAPRVWLLAQRTNHRIFQHLSTPEIARVLLSEWSIHDAVWRIHEADHPRAPYRVQYGETDLDFLSRLLEETGIATTFDDEDGERSRLVLSDALHLSAPRPELDPNRGLLITSLSIDGSPDGDWTTRATAVPAPEPYRPPLRTPRPKVHGIQSAIVVGPPGQEIHTDEHGRVRVQFLWDREGKLNEHSSCWLRVSQGWAAAAAADWVPGSAAAASSRRAAGRSAAAADAGRGDAVRHHL